MTPALSARYIIHRTAVYYGIDPAMITSERRARAMARPRQAAMWLCSRLLPHLSLPVLGRAFGRDHTTVLHGIRRINALRGHDVMVLDATDTLLAAIAAEVAQPDEMSRAATAGQGVLDIFTLALNAMVRRDPAGTLVLFRRWLDDLRPEQTAEDGP